MHGLFLCVVFLFYSLNFASALKLPHVYRFEQRLRQPLQLLVFGSSRQELAGTSWNTGKSLKYKMHASMQHGAFESLYGDGASVPRGDGTYSWMVSFRSSAVNLFTSPLMLLMLVYVGLFGHSRICHAGTVFAKAATAISNRLSPNKDGETKFITDSAGIRFEGLPAAYRATDSSPSGSSSSGGGSDTKHSPFQSFECASCHLVLQPAPGRAAKVLGRERFRCVRCGAPSSAFFDVADLRDPRALQRQERLRREAEEALHQYDDVDVYEDL
jgi:hypothetical protein